MPIKIRDVGSIAEKWARVTPERSEDYRLGVTSPKEDWKTKTEAAKEIWKAAMTKAVADDRFGKGVAKVNTDKWRSKALSKGVARFGEGVAVAKPDYESGFKPYRDLIAGISLPPRYPRGDVRNIERVKVIANTLHLAKVGG